MDSCDLAFEENEREISTMLSERGRLKLGRIDDTLRRIVSPNHGLCEMCGLAIPWEAAQGDAFYPRLWRLPAGREIETKARRNHKERDD